MTGRIQDIETAVTKIVMILQPADTVLGSTEIELPRFTPFVVGLTDRGLFTFRVTWEKGSFEAWTDDQSRAAGERAGISDVIIVPVTPDECLNCKVRHGDAALPQDLSNIHFYLDG